MELIRQEDIGEARIVVASVVGLQTVEENMGLSPMTGTVFAFIITESGQKLLVVSEKLIPNDVAEVDEWGNLVVTLTL